MSARTYPTFTESERAELRARQAEINEYLYDANAVIEVASVLEYKFPRQMSTLWDLANSDREGLRRMLVVLHHHSNPNRVWMGGSN
ncbi:MAG: hypothetical protein H0T73_07335 [Ardenticatenales bacterium]|nr:hypothetical protein [Ardenticatenales bacterium]